MSEKKKKKSNIIIKIIISVFMVVIAYMILWSIPFPHTKTELESYDEFVNLYKYFYFYSESIPSSTNVIKYYDYSGWGDNITGAIFSLNKADYEKFKYDHTTGDSYYIDEDGNGYIEYEKYSDEIFFERVNNFLNYMIGDDLENYIILKKRINNGDGWYTSTVGVMANDETNTILLFIVYDKYPSKR